MRLEFLFIAYTNIHKRGMPMHVIYLVAMFWGSFALSPETHGSPASPIFGISSQDPEAFCSNVKVQPLPDQLSKAVPKGNSDKYGMGKFEDEALKVHRHFFSLAEGCRSRYQETRDRMCSQIIESLGRVVDGDYYKPNQWGKATWTLGFSMSTRIGFPMLMALETAKTHLGESRSLIDIEKRFHRWLDARAKKASTFYENKPDNLWANQDTAWAIFYGSYLLQRGDNKGLAVVDEAVGRVLNSLRPDGSIPMETKRGAMALHYTALEMSNLLRGLMILRANSAEDSKKIEAFETALVFYLDALQDLEKVDDYAAENVMAGRPNPKEQNLSSLSGGIGMVRLYIDKFDKPELFNRLAAMLLDQRICAYEDRNRRPPSRLASCPTLKLKNETSYYFMTTLGNDSCLYKSFGLKKITTQETVSKPTINSVLDIGSSSTAEICERAIVEWENDRGEWVKVAESRGLTLEGCRLFIK